MPRLLTDYELMIMLAILRLRNDGYGVYLALDRLERHGLVASELGEATAQRGGRAKKYFRVTTKGLHAVRATQRAFIALWTGIPQLQGGTR
jgi:PadR family transcriptional regulator